MEIYNNNTEEKALNLRFFLYRWSTTRQNAFVAVLKYSVGINE